MAARNEQPGLNFSHASKKGFRIWLVMTLGLASLGVLQLLIASLVAALHFPEGYSMEDNFISDLGRSSHEYSDLFNFSLIFLGLSLFPLFISLIIVDSRDSFSMKLAAGFGVLSATGLVGLGLTPIDKFLISHYLALGLWLFPMFYMLIVFYYGATRTAYVGIGFLSLSLFTVVLMLVVLLRANATGYQVVQKLIVAFGLVWLLYIMAFILQSGRLILKTMKEPDNSIAELEDEYFSEMYRQEAAQQKRV